MKSKAFDSTLAFFINQLDNLDQRLYEPLFDISWDRDINLRSGITMANESTSFIRSTFAGAGTQSANGKPWISPNTTQLPGVSVDGERVVQPLRTLGRELSYTSVELERSQMLGQPLDVTKFNALNAMYQMDTDQMVYMGDNDVHAKGLLNSDLVLAEAVKNGAKDKPQWESKTADEILDDVNAILDAAWQNAGYAVCPDKLLIPPTQFSLLNSKKVSDLGTMSVLTYIRENSICLARNGRPLDVQPVKWLKGIGTGGSDRMVAYTNKEDFVRFPMVPVRRETPYYLGVRFNAPYIWAFGEMEFVRPATLLYRDGI